jgi:hypothetical protein
MDEGRLFRLSEANGRYLAHHNRYLGIERLDDGEFLKAVASDE